MSSLALIEAISFFSDVQKKRYSVKRERYWQKKRQLFAPATKNDSAG